LTSQGLGLSQFTVFFSFFVWAYIFGAIGGLLSVSLTLLVKLLLEASDDTSWLAVLMDDKVSVAPTVSDTPAARKVTTTSEALDPARSRNA
jgi:predicted PurR-regulated permease PerM